MLSRMNADEDAPVVPLTARTEYLTGRHRLTATTSGAALMTAMVALVALNYAEVPPSLTAATVMALITVSLGAMALGRLTRPGAVLITVDGDTVHLGDETVGVTGYPLSSLIAVNQAGPADEKTAHGRRLTVRGRKYLTLTFATEGTATDEWRLAVIESDPAAAEILRRLKAAVHATDAGPGAEDVSRRSGVSAARIADAGTDEAAKRLWEEAVRRHDDILGAYGAYELDPAMLLRYPAVTDVTVEPTQTFHVALDEAGALRTEAYPGNRGLADAYQQKVVTLRRAWIACESHGKRVGTSYLAPADRAELDTALKLYNHAASSTTVAEQATYYGRVHEIVTELTGRGVLHPPRVQLAQLEAVTRRAIEAARPG